MPLYNINKHGFFEILFPQLILLVPSFPRIKSGNNHPTSIQLFKVNNEISKATCEIWSKTKKQWHRKNVNDLVLVSLLLTLNRFYPLIWSSHCWFQTSKRQLDILELSFISSYFMCVYLFCFWWKLKWIKFIFSSPQIQ